ncbi:hypothetical protein D3C85_1234420 [compost metagenome]
MDQWTRYLFESHPEKTLRLWSQRLSLFRFFRAYGGHANDDDSLDVAYRYESFQELEKFLNFLGVNLIKYSEQSLQPQHGVSYKGDEFTNFPSLIAGTRWVQQPGHSIIAGQKVFIWCERGLIKISIGESYQVTEADVASAEMVEKLLFDSNLERIDPPFDTKHYICPKYHPTYFT